MWVTHTACRPINNDNNQHETMYNMGVATKPSLLPSQFCYADALILIIPPCKLGSYMQVLFCLDNDGLTVATGSEHTLGRSDMAEF